MPDLWDSSLSGQVLQTIQTVIDNKNPYTNAFLHMYRKVEERAAFQRARTDGSETPLVFMQFLDGPDPCRYKAPFVNEVAAIFSSSDGAPPEQEFVLHYRDHGFQDIHFSYPLLFPCGDPGFQLGMSHSGPCVTLQQNKITMREFYNYRICERENFNPILESGLLFQQLLVDSYCKIEHNSINHLR